MEMLFLSLKRIPAALVVFKRKGRFSRPFGLTTFFWLAVAAAIAVAVAVTVAGSGSTAIVVSVVAITIIATVLVFALVHFFYFKLQSIVTA